jgi:hypothetical protein
MSRSNDGVWRVEKALAAIVGDRAGTLMHRRSRHLGGLTPHELAAAPGGAPIVLAELNKIILQAEQTRT